MGNACACMSKSSTLEDSVENTEREAVREAAPGGVDTPSPINHKRKRQEHAPGDSLRADALEASVEVRTWPHTPLVHHAHAELDFLNQ
jgi:hypothetical protein